MPVRTPISPHLPVMDSSKSLLSILSAAALLLISAQALAAAPAIVANPDTKLEKLSKEDAKNILLGTKTSTDGGVQLRLAVLKGSPSHAAAVQAFTGRTADQFDKYWKKQVFSGKSIAPDAFESDAELIAFVAKTPGAIGYIDDATPVAGVQVVPVGG